MLPGHILKPLMVVILISLVITSYNAQVIYSQPQESKESLYRDFLISQLTPLITKAIDDYYGYHKPYDLFDSKVLEIKRLEEGSFYFEIILQVVSYTGAHNEPLGLETVTIVQDHRGIRVTNFKHEEYKRE